MICETQYQKMYVVDESTYPINFDNGQFPLPGAAPTDDQVGHCQMSTNIVTVGHVQSSYNPRTILRQMPTRNSPR
jgi:hypothetical protein